MTLEEKGMFLQTILDYQNGIDVVPEWCIKFIWGRVKNQIDTDNAKWEEERRKRSEAGRLGWISRAKSQNQNLSSNSKQCLAMLSSVKQAQANQAVNVNVNDNVNDNVTTTTTQQLFREFKKFYPKPCNGTPKDYLDVIDGMVDEDRDNLIRDAKIIRGKILFGAMDKRFVTDPLKYLQWYVYSEDNTMFELGKIKTALSMSENIDAHKENWKKFKASVWDSFIKKVWDELPEVELNVPN